MPGKKTVFVGVVSISKGIQNVHVRILSLSYISIYI